MNQKISKILVIMTCCLCSVFATFAQNQNPSNLTSSSYTRYGLGKLGSVGNAATKGMGDLGIVTFSNAYTNLYNPASLTAIDTLTMLVEAGLNAEWQFSTENDKHWLQLFFSSLPTLESFCWSNISYSIFNGRLLLRSRDKPACRQ